MSNQEVAISINNVSKSFKLPHEQDSGLKQVIINKLKRNKKRGYEIQHVLDDISFDVKKGEFFGIVGRNGSGKSTLLKLISEIYEPDKGTIQVNGTLTPFIELGVGFNPELTGRENVYMNGALMGFSNKQMDTLYDEIVEFAELERFMDQKLKNYSSGMQVRLAFSIAIRAKSDILILDEVLAVGDEAFQRKCNEFFARIKKDRTKTVILVTHSMEAVRKYCNKAIMLREGKVVVYGSPEDVSNEYSVENLKVDSNASNDEKVESLIKDFKVELSPDKQINQSSMLELKVSYKVLGEFPTRVKLSLQDIGRNVPLFASNSPLIYEDKVVIKLFAKLSSINDTDIKVLATVRNEAYEIVGFLPDHLSPVFALKRTDYLDPTVKTTWAVLYDRGEWK